MELATKIMPAKVLVGTVVRTNNSREADQATACIGSLWARYLQERIAEKIEGRTCPGVTWAVYTNYESDHTGEYTLFLGEEVDHDVVVPNELLKLCIPSQRYLIYTTDVGPLPAVVINTWQTIWNRTFQERGVERAFIADFELYDERAIDSQNALVDIYIGIKS